MNPRGQVPVFKDGDTVVSESLAALQYLEQAYPEPCLVPQDSIPQVSQSMHPTSAVLKQLICLMCFVEASGHSQIHGHPPCSPNHAHNHFQPFGPGISRPN